MYPELNIDPFASRLNNQLDVYCSSKPDPGCTYVDAFSIDWSNFNILCVENFARQGTGNTTDPCVANTDMVPTCSTTVIQPTVDFQTISKPTMPCPLQGATPTTQEPALDGLSFITGTPSHSKTFLQTLPTYSWRPGGKELKTSTEPMWKNGWHFVVKGKSITVLPR